MIRIKKTASLIVMIAFLIGSMSLHAAAPNKGMKNEEGQLLSQVTTYAGSGALGADDGALLEATFRVLSRLVVLDDGSVWVSDQRNHKIRQISNGEVATMAGQTFEFDDKGFPIGGWHDAEATSAVFNHPAGMAVGQDGTVYVADSENHLVRAIAPDGQVSTVAGDSVIGSQDGIGDHARFYSPQDVAVAPDGSLYVADTLNHLIRKVSTKGEVTTLNTMSERIALVHEGAVLPAGDFKDGKLSEALFNEPTSIVVDRKGNLYVSDSGNHSIRYIDLETETVSTVAGIGMTGEVPYDAAGLYAIGGYVDGTASEARFFFPKGIAINNEEGLLIADSSNHTVRYLINNNVITIAGDVDGLHGYIDGINGHNQLHYPTDVAILSNGNIIIVDSYNNVLREYSLYHLPSRLPINDEVKVVFNDDILAIDNELDMRSDRVMINSDVFDKDIGIQMTHDGALQSVYFNHDRVRVGLTVGSTQLTYEANDSDPVVQEIDVAPYVKNGSIYVPIRFVSEALGLAVDWNENNRTVIIRQVNP